MKATAKQKARVTKVHVSIGEKVSLSIPEACGLAGVERDFLYREINSGRLKTAKIGGRRLIRREALEAWLTRQEDVTTKEMHFAATA